MDALHLHSCAHQVRVLLVGPGVQLGRLFTWLYPHSFCSHPWAVPWSRASDASHLVRAADFASTFDHSIACLQRDLISTWHDTIAGIQLHVSAVSPALLCLTTECFKNITLASCGQVKSEANESEAFEDLHAARVYEHIKPSGQEAALEADMPELRPQLRPYQLRAAAWMVAREQEPEAQVCGLAFEYVRECLCACVHATMTLYATPAVV